MTTAARPAPRKPRPAAMPAQAAHPRSAKAVAAPSIGRLAPERTYTVEEWKQLSPAKQRALRERECKAMKVIMDRIGEHFRQSGLKSLTYEEILAVGRDDDDE